MSEEKSLGRIGFDATGGIGWENVTPVERQKWDAGMQVVTEEAVRRRAVKPNPERDFVAECNEALTAKDREIDRLKRELALWESDGDNLARKTLAAIAGQSNAIEEVESLRKIARSKGHSADYWGSRCEDAEEQNARLRQVIFGHEIVCLYCGTVFKRSQPDHWRTCPKHPAAKEVAELNKQIAEANAKPEPLYTDREVAERVINTLAEIEIGRSKWEDLQGTGRKNAEQWIAIARPLLAEPKAGSKPLYSDREVAERVKNELTRRHPNRFHPWTATWCPDKKYYTEAISIARPLLTATGETERLRQQVVELQYNLREIRATGVGSVAGPLKEADDVD